MTLALFRTRTGYGAIESLLFDRVIRPLAAPFHDCARGYIDSRLGPGMRVLDVGCGGGVFTLPLADRHPDIEVTGIDLSQRLIGWARQRGQPYGERVRFIEASALSLPFADASFDVVFSLGSIKHWSDPLQGVREAVRVLAPGGGLIVLEGERGARDEDVDALVHRWGFPRPLHGLGGRFFRSTVVGTAMDLGETLALLEQVPELDGTVERASGWPIVVLTGTRAQVTA